MRMHRSSLLAFGGIALCAGMLAFGSSTMVPTAAWACPDEANAGEGGKCACGKDHADCAAAKEAGGCQGGCEGGCADKAKEAGGCQGCEGGCAGKAADDKACGCDHDADGKCACGGECPSEHGGNCTKKEGAAAPAEEKPGGCQGDKGEGASAAPGGHLQAVIDPATGELVAPGDDDAAGIAASATAETAPVGEKQVARDLGNAGTVVAFPDSKVSRAVATVDANGKVHVGCERGIP